MHGAGHVTKPGVALGHANDERGVAHTQAWVTPLLAVGARPSPVLHQKQGQVLLGVGEIFGVAGTKQLVASHSGVEVVDQGYEKGGSPNNFEDRCRSGFRLIRGL